MKSKNEEHISKAFTLKELGMTIENIGVALSRIDKSEIRIFKFHANKLECPNEKAITEQQKPERK